MKGMSAPAGDLYYGLPLWMKVAFAVGSIGGLVGSVLLGLRRSAAVTVLAASLKHVQRSPVRCGIHGWAEAWECSVAKRRRRGWGERTARTCGIG